MNPHLVVEVPGDEGGAVRDAGDDAAECHAPTLVDMELPGLGPAPCDLDPGCDHPELEAPGQLGQGRHLALVQARVCLAHLPDGQAPDSGGRCDDPHRLEPPDAGRVSISNRIPNHFVGFRWNEAILRISERVEDGHLNVWIKCFRIGILPHSKIETISSCQK